MRLEWHRRETRYAVATQITSLTMMYLAIGTTFAVAVCGFIDKVDRHIVRWD